MLEKKFIKSRKTSQVIFALPTTELPEMMEARTVSLVGDFNNWDPAATPMKLGKGKGMFRATVDLEPETAYQFRYLVNGDQWVNDWHADAYAPNGLGEENGIVRTAAAPIT